MSVLFTTVLPLTLTFSNSQYKQTKLYKFVQKLEADADNIQVQTVWLCMFFFN